MGARILSGRLHDSDAKFLDQAKSEANKRQKKRNTVWKYWKRKMYSSAMNGGISRTNQRMTPVTMKTRRIRPGHFLDIQMT
jgi:hypothetical protein